MKKFLSVIFMACIILSCNVQAQTEIFTYTVTDGKVTIISCDKSVSGVVEIPEKIEGFPVTKIESHAFYECNKITEVRFLAKIEEIGALSFANCTSLKTVNIPKSVKEIGSGVFWFTENLEKIVVEDGNEFFYSEGNCLIKKENSELIAGCKTSVIPEINSIGNGAFNGCTGLLSISMPDTVEKIGPLAFSNCNNLKSVVFSENLEEIGTSAFNTCTSLTNVTLPQSVKKMGGSVFYLCTSLTELEIPQNVEDIGSAFFYGCENLQSVKISQKVNNIAEYAFYKCENLKSIQIDEKNTVYYSKGNCIIKKSNNSIILACNTSIIPDEATRISYDSFAICSEMESIYIPKNITKIDNSAFYGCNKLKTVYFGGSEEEWNNISINTSGNGNLTKSKIVFNYKIKFGDVNNDDAVNKKDVLALSKYLANDFDGINLNASDAFYDYVINKKDLLKLNQHLADPDVVLGR